MKRPIAVLAVLTLVAALGSAAIAAPCDKAAETGQGHVVKIPLGFGSSYPADNENGRG